MLVRIASDISPLQLQRYEQHPDPANLDQFSALSERLLSLLPESRKTKITLVTESRAARETFPIHRSINSGRLDWFATFGQLLFQLNTVPDPRLPSRLLYYGPGMGRRWLREADKSVANNAQRAAFERFLSGGLSRVPLGKNLAVLDLGVGAFDKARLLLAHPSLENISSHYVAFDISYEMLNEALTRTVDGGLLRALSGRGGGVMGVNDDFRLLGNYEHLTDDSDTRLYCLLGNTLGNEWFEDETLSALRKVMREDDRLLLEVQLLEDQPIALHEMEAAVAEDLEFYAGPFIVCGVDSTAVGIRIESEERFQDGQRLATCYSILCEFQRNQTARHIALDRDYDFFEGRRVSTYLVKKYDLNALASYLKSRGFTHALEPVAIPSGKRRFGYFCVARSQ